MVKRIPDVYETEFIKVLAACRKSMGGINGPHSIFSMYKANLQIKEVVKSLLLHQPKDVLKRYYDSYLVEEMMYV